MKWRRKSGMGFKKGLNNELFKDTIAKTTIATPNVIGTKLHNIDKFKGDIKSPIIAITVPHTIPRGPAIPGPHKVATIFRDGRYIKARVKPVYQGLNSCTTPLIYSTNTRKSDTMSNTLK